MEPTCCHLVDCEFKFMEQSTGNILQYYIDKFVQAKNIYDLRAVGPERYKDYTDLSYQVELELEHLLHATLPRIKQLRGKLDKLREEVVVRLEC